MISLTSKVCVVGDFAVGKTSVVERFVNNQFSEKYLSTVGVKIDTKEIEHSELGVSHKLVVWDVAGSDRFGPTEFAYLRGANGYILVADGTRPMTLASLEALHAQIDEQYGPSPCIVLVNKRDLVAEWGVSDERFDELSSKYKHIYKTSAKIGTDVEQAMIRLAEMIVEIDLRES